MRPEVLPRWLTEDDLAFYVKEFSRTGFRGGLNWYRNIKALPTILGPFAGAAIHQPALYLAGEYDVIAGNTPEALADLPAQVPGLRNMKVFRRRRTLAATGTRAGGQPTSWSRS